MVYQNIFRYSYLEEIKRDVIRHNKVDPYLGSKFNHESDNVIQNKNIKIPDKINLKMPKGGEKYDFENARIIYDAYKDLDRTQASDARMWTYLTHVTFWSYMQKRTSIENYHKKLDNHADKLNEKKTHILEHWFLNGLSPKTLLRNNISLLWWGAYLTYDENRKDPYELTKELFSMLDYTRHLLSGVQGRNNNFTQMGVKGLGAIRMSNNKIIAITSIPAIIPDYEHIAAG